MKIIDDNASAIKFRKFIRAIGYAIEGIKHGLKTQSNFFYQFLFIVGLSPLNYVLHFNFAEWCWFVAGHILIASFEIMNTAIEGLCEMHTTKFDERIKIIKDAAAGSVLLAIFFCATYYTGMALPKLLFVLFNITI